MDQRAMPGTTHCVTDCQYCTNLSSWHLNVNDSTPVFASCSIIMCNEHRVSNENLVVMQAH